MAPDSLSALISLQRIEFVRADEVSLVGNSEKKENLRQMIPADVLDAYDTLKERFQDKTVVRVDNNTCPGCHIKLPTFRSIEISSNVFLCEHCGRMLYSAENGAVRSLV